MREEESGTRRHLVEEEELLLLTDLAVIALGGLLEQVLVFCESLCRVSEVTHDTRFKPSLTALSGNETP